MLEVQPDSQVPQRPAVDPGELFSQATKWFDEAMALCRNDEDKKALSESIFLAGLMQVSTVKPLSPEQYMEIIRLSSEEAEEMLNTVATLPDPA